MKLLSQHLRHNGKDTRSVVTAREKNSKLPVASRVTKMYFLRRTKFNTVRSVLRWKNKIVIIERNQAPALLLPFSY